MEPKLYAKIPFFTRKNNERLVYKFNSEKNNKNLNNDGVHYKRYVRRSFQHS